MKKNDDLLATSVPPQIQVFFEVLKTEYHIQAINPQLWVQALTHKSYHFENTARSQGHNEVLEFLGDRALDLILADKLVQQFPAHPEGVLSKLKASLVSEQPLSEIATQMKLGAFLLLGEGEGRSRGAEKPRLLASAIEALIGAAYLDLGYEAAQKWALLLFKDHLAHVSPDRPFSEDFKTRLQEWTQAQSRRTPSYRLLAEQGPDHQKTFFVEVWLDNECLGKGEGKTKKLAEQAAARQALEQIDGLLASHD